MSSYKFFNPKGVYFISFAVVEWLDVFTRNEYKDILIRSLEFCQKNKGMEIYSWCIMTNHVHLVFKSVGDEKPQDLVGKFKRFTSNQIIRAIKENRKESRREILLSAFKRNGQKASNVSKYQFWRHDNHPIELWSKEVLAQKIRYTHNNPVKQGYVFRPEDFVYSSAVDYSGEKGVLDGVVVLSL